MASHQVVIVGAGPAGISTAVALKDRGIQPLVIDRAEEVGSSWRSRYDRLRLNTGKQFSHLPGRPYPKDTPTWPTRDQVVAHLERHAHEDGIELMLGRPVARIEQRDGGWDLDTPEGVVAARQVVVATGHEHSPLIPDWPGRTTFGGDVLHSSEYRNPVASDGRP